jgi:hypothetical protein
MNEDMANILIRLAGFVDVVSRVFMQATIHSMQKLLDVVLLENSSPSGLATQ